MKFADAHCDFLSVGGFENSCMSLSDLIEYDSCIIFFACFISPKYYDCPRSRFSLLKKRYFNIMGENSGTMAHCVDLIDVNKAEDERKISCFLTVEGCEFIDGEADIENMYKSGIRLAAPMWNNTNKIANENGLTNFGRRIIQKMNEIGIFTDVSHMNDKTFFDVLELSDRPIFASHSNSRAVCNNLRNLTDEQILQIISRNGFIGINLYPPFLNDKTAATVEDVFRHAEHILSLGGENNVGLGCDFDGMDYMMKEICGAADVYKIIDCMSAHGYSDDLLKKISYDNLKNAIGNF